MSAAPIPAAPPGPVARWVEGARPRTLPAAIVPVIVGTAAVRPAALVPGRLALALVVALALQVGTNYANDYSDGVRGTDEVRVGPVRLVGQGLASPGAVKRAALGSFLVAAIAGLWLCSMAGWWLVIPGVLAVAAGWLYTGGPRPYGYLGLGELFVFVFFGLFATVGSAYVQHGSVPGVTWPAAVVVGLLASALLEANNLRDIDGDVEAGKRTVAVRLGRQRAGLLYVGNYVGAAVALILCAIGRPLAALGLVGLVAAIPGCRLALSEGRGRALLPMLKSSARAQLAVGVLLALGLAIA